MDKDGRPVQQKQGSLMRKKYASFHLLTTSSISAIEAVRIDSFRSWTQAHTILSSCTHIRYYICTEVLFWVKKCQKILDSSLRKILQTDSTVKEELMQKLFIVNGIPKCVTHPKKIFCKDIVHTIAQGWVWYRESGFWYTIIVSEFIPKYVQNEKCFFPVFWQIFGKCDDF